ncbi:MAG: T9SS type A sorting domain-containing protein [Cytophagales bacterium]|nr:T9SS type A sorting domain-containing protein [Cytophagales bacterium]
MTNKQVNIHITNTPGQKLYEWNGKITSGKFSQEINLTGAPQGVFFVEMMIDNITQVRKVIKMNK